MDEIPDGRARRCHEAAPLGLREGVSMFNLGAFQECQEALEDLWVGEERSLQPLYKGLILLAGAFHHLEAGHFGWSSVLLSEARDVLAPYAPRCHDIDIAALERQLANCQSILSGLGRSRLRAFPWGQTPKIRLLERDQAPE